MSTVVMERVLVVPTELFHQPGALSRVFGRRRALSADAFRSGPYQLSAAWRGRAGPELQAAHPLRHLLLSLARGRRVVSVSAWQGARRRPPAQQAEHRRRRPYLERRRGGHRAGLCRRHAPRTGGRSLHRHPLSRTLRRPDQRRRQRSRPRPPGRRSPGRGRPASRPRPRERSGRGRLSTDRRDSRLSRAVGNLVANLPRCAAARLSFVRRRRPIGEPRPRR